MFICIILDDDSDTATEGEEEIRARELRKQEVRVEPPIDAGTDTEVKPLSNYTFDPNSPNLVSNQNLCTVDMPDILNNMLKVSKSSDNMSSTNEQFNSAESEVDDMYKSDTQSELQDMQKITKRELPTPNFLSKSSTTSSINNAPVKRNFVLPPKERRKSFGREFVPVVEQEPLLVIKRTPSKINLPVEIGKPKVQVKTNLENAKKYFGEPRRPSILKPPIDKSKKSPLLKQASLPERSTISPTITKVNSKQGKQDERRESLFNFEPEESDLNEIDNYIENLIKTEQQLLHPIQSNNNNNNEEEEGVSSSIEDLLKALEVETNVEEDEIVEVKPEEKIENLLNWIEELDHKAEDTQITSSLKSDKYKNLEENLKKPSEADNVIHKLCKDNISQFESHLLGRIQKFPEINSNTTDNYQLSKSKTDIYCNKPRTSVDLDAVKKVDIKKVLQKFENNESKDQDFKQPRRSIVVPKNIVKRNSFANFSFNRSFEKDEKQPVYDQYRDNIGSKDFKTRAEMFEKKLQQFDNQSGKTQPNLSQEKFGENLRRSPLLLRKFSQSKSNSQSPQRMKDKASLFDDNPRRSPSFLRRFQVKATSESPQRTKNIIGDNLTESPSKSPSFLRKFRHLKSNNQSPNKVANYDSNSNNELPQATLDGVSKFDDLSLKSPSVLKGILQLESQSSLKPETTNLATNFDETKTELVKPKKDTAGNHHFDPISQFNRSNTDSLQATEDDRMIASELAQKIMDGVTIDLNLNQHQNKLAETVKNETNQNRSGVVDVNNSMDVASYQNYNQPSAFLNDKTFYDKIQLDQLLRNTEQAKDKIVTNYEEIANVGKEVVALNDNRNEGNTISGLKECNFDDITLDKEASSPVQENYFQALVTVKNIIKNLNMQQETDSDQNTENQLQPALNKDISMETMQHENAQEEITFHNIHDKEPIKDKELNDSSLKENDSNSEVHQNTENRREIIESNARQMDKEVNKEIDRPIDYSKSAIPIHIDLCPETLSNMNQNLPDIKKIDKKQNLAFTAVDRHPLVDDKYSLNNTINIKLDLPESTIKQTPSHPVVPQRNKRDHNISMIPRLTRQDSSENKSIQFSSKNMIRPPQLSTRAASASPGVSRRMDTSFTPVPPIRKKSTASTAASNTSDGRNAGNLPEPAKLNERSTSADNIEMSKKRNDTLRGKIFSKGKEKECLIQ